MLISRVWLEELLAPDSVELDDEALGAAITSLGLEVDGVTKVGRGLESVRLARVESIAPHPNAEKLQRVELDDGRSKHSVICGAANVPAPGGIVVFAPIGTNLPNGVELRPREIRGVRSEGMICAETELGIGPDGDGILVLPSAWPAGDRLIDRVPGIVDTIYELGVTPNRPDALGHVGVARDLAVKFRCDLRLPKLDRPELASLLTLVNLEAVDRCGRYIGCAFDGIEVAPSPEWLRVRLHRIGLRAINNIVDITNLVMMEWGTPLHAFDRDRLDGGRVVIRRALEGERLETLQGRTLELVADDLVIADATTPQALAGVMGGGASGVTTATKRILLEAAWFEPGSIRRSARRHQLATDSSYRFERGVDHGAGLTAAAARAGALIEAIAGGRGIARCEALGQPRAMVSIPFRPARSAMVLGTTIPDDEADRILRGIGVSVDRADHERWHCEPPTHRPDLAREVDLIEEVIRHHGLDALPAGGVASPESRRDAATDRPVGEYARGVADTALDSSASLERQAAEVALDLELRIVDAFREQGLHEHVSLVFAEAMELEPFAEETPVDRAVVLTNPIRAQAGWLRTHLLPGLLRALSINVARHPHAVRLFEYGRIYAWPTSDRPRTRHAMSSETIDAMLPNESRRVAVLLSPGLRPGAVSSIDARTVAEILLSAVDRLGVRGQIVPLQSAPSVSWLHPGVQALVARDDRPLGRFGEIHPDLKRPYGIPDEVRAYYGELWFEALPTLEVVRYQPVPRFPSTTRDLSLDLAMSVPTSVVVDSLVRAERAVAQSGEDPARLWIRTRGEPAVDFVEDYRGVGVAPGRRALLFRLHYAAQGRSVTDAEVQLRHDAVVSDACSELRALDEAVRAR